MKIDFWKEEGQQVTVRELIEALQRFNPDLPVRFFNQMQSYGSPTCEIEDAADNDGKPRVDITV